MFDSFVNQALLTGRGGLPLRQYDHSARFNRPKKSVQICAAF
jgi:hypothetical protein